MAVASIAAATVTFDDANWITPEAEQVQLYKIPGSEKFAKTW